MFRDDTFSSNTEMYHDSVHFMFQPAAAVKVCSMRRAFFNLCNKIALLDKPTASI